MAENRFLKTFQNVSEIRARMLAVSNIASAPIFYVYQLHDLKPFYSEWALLYALTGEREKKRNKISSITVKES